MTAIVKDNYIDGRNKFQNSFLFSDELRLLDKTCVTLLVFLKVDMALRFVC